MKPTLALLLTASFAALSSPASAQDAGAQLAAKKNCLACHQVDKKLVGPSYKSIAAKYAGDKGAADMLATKIMKGGSGVWGPVPMPANPQVSDAEARQLAAWVLTLK